jgi:hypothetical protein
MQDDDTPSAAQKPNDDAGDKKLGRVAIKRVKVKRSDVERQRAARAAQSPMNMLVPYLDLFGRLHDEELARLAGVAQEVVTELRKQVLAVKRGLAPYIDLLPRLSDDELARLTGASAKTVRFWRLCRPKADEDLGPAESRTRPAAATAAASARAQPGQAAAASAGVPAPVSTQAHSSLEGFSGEPVPGFEADGGEVDEEESGDIEIGVFEDDDGEDEIDLEEDDEDYL